MASNPRKFSEKIALHNQKQMEETAAFEKIMREVSDATSKQQQQQQTSPSGVAAVSMVGPRTLAPGPSLGVYRGGSLPNVSHQRQQQQQVVTAVLPPAHLLLQQKKIIVLTAPAGTTHLQQQQLIQDETTTTGTATKTDSIYNDELLAQFGLSEAAGDVASGGGSNHSSSTMLDNSFKGGGGNNGGGGGGGMGSNSDTNSGGGGVGGGGGMVKSNSTNLSHSSSNLSGGSNNSNSGSQGQQSHHQSRVRNVGVGPMRRPADRKIDTSPYGNNIAYLSPPSDSSWRRTSSDSAIHQSLNQQQGSPYHHHHQYTSHSPLTLSPTAQKKHPHGHQHQQHQQQQQQHMHQQHQQHQQQLQQQQQQHHHQMMAGVSLSHSNINATSQQQMLGGGGAVGGSLFHGHNVGHSQSNQQINFIVGGDGTTNSGGIGIIDNGRPRSSCGRLPGINIHPSAHDNSVQIPIGNNTGSLPDLTSVHFPSPLHTPIDQEHDHSSSPYSSSPITASPTTLSPTSMPVRHPGARFQYSPAGSPGDGNGSASFSPTHSQQNTSQHFLSVPGSHRYSHFNNKGVTMDTSYHQQSPQGSSTTTSYMNCQTTSPGQQQQQQSQYQQQQQQQQQGGQPQVGTIHGSHGNLSNIPQANLSGYRSPQCRPSPGSSPNLIGALTNSSGDNSNPSAPCSPSPAQAPSPSNNGQNGSGGGGGGGYGDQYSTNNANDIYYINQQNIQQHFESFSLVDNPDFITNQDAQTFAQFDDASFTNFTTSPGMTTMNQQQQNSGTSDTGGGGGGVSNNSGGSSSGGGGNSSGTTGQDDDSSIKSLLMNPMIGSQQSTNMTNGLDLGQQLQQQQQQQQQQQHSSLVTPSLQTPNTPTSIPEIIFTDFSSSAGSEFTKEIFDDTLMPLELELGQMDVAGFQMLANPNATMIADPTDEDTFRQDLH